MFLADFQQRAVADMAMRERGSYLTGAGEGACRVGVLGNARGSGKTHVVASLIAETLDAPQFLPPPLMRHIRGGDTPPEWYMDTSAGVATPVLQRTTVVLCPELLVHHWVSVLGMYIPAPGMVRVLDDDTPSPSACLRAPGVVVLAANRSSQWQLLLAVPPHALGRLVVDEARHALGGVIGIFDHSLLRAAFVWLVHPGDDAASTLRALDAAPLPERAAGIVRGMLSCADAERFVVATTLAGDPPPARPSPPDQLYSSCLVVNDSFDAAPGAARGDGCPCAWCLSEGEPPIAARELERDVDFCEAYPRLAPILGLDHDPAAPAPEMLACPICCEPVFDAAHFHEKGFAGAGFGAARARIVTVHSCCGWIMCAECALQCGDACPQCRSSDHASRTVRNWGAAFRLPTLPEVVSATLAALARSFDGAMASAPPNSVCPPTVLLVLPRAVDTIQVVTSTLVVNCPIPITCLDSRHTLTSDRARPTCTVTRSVNSVLGLPIRWTHVIGDVSHDDVAPLARRSAFYASKRAPLPEIVRLSRVSIPADPPAWDEKVSDALALADLPDV